MGNIITNWAKKQKCGKGEVKSILLCLADAAFDSERGSIEMTVPQIAEVVEFSERAIYRWLDILEGEDLQLITRKKTKKSDGTNNPNVYQINCPAEIFAAEKPTDCQTPCQPVLVTDRQNQNDCQSAGETEKDEKSAETLHEPNQGDCQSVGKLSDSQYEQGDCQSPSTVLKEEEFKNINTQVNKSHTQRVRAREADSPPEILTHPEISEFKNFGEYRDYLLDWLKAKDGVIAFRYREESAHKKGLKYLFDNKASPADAIACYVETIGWKKANTTWETVADEWRGWKAKQGAQKNGANQNGNGKPARKSFDKNSQFDAALDDIYNDPAFGFSAGSGGSRN